MISRQSIMAFLRFLRTRPAAMIALAIIGLTLMLALFAYPLAPDPSPQANRMILEFGGRPPGFRQSVFLMPAKIAPDPDISVWKRFWNGWHSPFDPLPITGWWQSKDRLHLIHYVDEGISDTLVYPFESLGIPASLWSSPSELESYILHHRLDEVHYRLGSDQYGRDILSRLLVGARVSLAVGVIAVLLSLTIGLLLGSLAGYFGGWVDAIIVWWIQVLWSIPTLLLVFAITLTIGKGFWEIFIAIGLTMWVGAARLIRGQVMALKELDYVRAAQTLGAGPFRIIFLHLWPNIAGPVMVIAASHFATAILIEAGLSFLGIGVQPPQPSWGLMIKEQYNFLLTQKPMMAIIPGAAIMILVWSFNVLGNALRDYFDVHNATKS